MGGKWGGNAGHIIRQGLIRQGLFRQSLGGMLFASCLWGGIAGVWPAHAREHQLDLHGSLVMALERHPQLKGAVSRSQRATSEAEIVRTRNKIALSIDANLGISDSYTRAGNSQTAPRRIGLNARQALYRGGRTPFEIAIADHNVTVQELQHRWLEQTILQEAALAYIELWQNQAVMQLQKAKEDRLRAYHTTAQERLALGQIAQREVAQAQSRYEMAVANRISSENRSQVSQARLSAALFFVIPEDAEFARPTISQAQNALIPKNEEAAIIAAQALGPQVRILEQRIASAQQELKRRHRAWWPEIGLEASAAFAEDPLGFEGAASRDAMATLTFSMPIYRSGALTAGVNVARAQAREARILKQDLLRSLRYAVSQYWSMRENSQKIAQTRKRQRAAATLALEGEKYRYTLGQGPLLDVLDAEQELLDADVALTTAQGEHMSASYRLLSVLGRIRPN